MPLHGVCTIALTPFTDEGDLDDESIGSLAEFYLNSGVHGVTILGIMGEAHKLSDAERQVVTERYVSAIAGVCLWSWAARRSRRRSSWRGSARRRRRTRR